jgi:hypothetical protein
VDYGFVDLLVFTGFSDPASDWGVFNVAAITRQAWRRKYAQP